MTQSKKLNIQVEIDDDVPTLNSDAGKIQQILFNLLSNAIKFTPERGSIRLSACTEGTDAVRLVVSDTGPGIPAEQQSVVFEKFRQADGSVTREHAGTGLGLPISRDLAQILGGSLQLTSTPSQGATFTVILPVEAPEQSPPVVFPLAGVPRRTPSGQTTRP
jgi:signal transduction histidine kinase